MTTYYDDNFGEYDIDDKEDIEFYHQCQTRSVKKKCACCGCIVKILPQYDKCDRCASILEAGGDPYC